MASENNQTQTGVVVLAHSSSPTCTCSRPEEEARRTDNSEVPKNCGRVLQSKQSSSSTHLLYRKLSCDREKETVLAEECCCCCLKCSSEPLCNGKTLCPDVSAAHRSGSLPKEEKTGKSLDRPGEGGDAGANRACSTCCSCTMSEISMSPNTSTSSPSSHSTPVHCPHLGSMPSRPCLRHIRRRSLPVTMLAFNKVKIRETLIETVSLLQPSNCFMSFIRLGLGSPSVVPLD